MNTDNKSKFGELFEESIKESNSNLNHLVEEKRNIDHGTDSSLNAYKFVETIISLENLEDFTNHTSFRNNSVSHKQFINLQKMFTKSIRHEVIIHGKGNHSRNNCSPMRSMVRKFLLNTSIVLAFCEAELKDGGNGATYVLIKK
jgi:dsDNA-specific endonuclease/ATPase MutS2